VSDQLSSAGFAEAVEDFRRARRAASLEQIISRISGRSAELLSYERVRRQLGAGGQKVQVRRNIPLDAIIGSVGRYTDFTRSFLPKEGIDEHRWARVKTEVTGLVGLPPIEVYQIGEAYFVRDGHHRVSVARRLEAKTIDAYVTEIQTKVPLSPDTQPDELILKAEYADFLAHTQLDELRPEANLEVTVPGQYQVLEEHISVHRYFMGLERNREIDYHEAVVHWYDAFYLPVVEVIHSSGILRDFPGRTETDLYLWVLDHRAALADELGWEVGPAAAAADLAAQRSRRPERVLSRAGRHVLETVLPDGLVGGPPAGAWRRERSAGRDRDRLFDHILVAIDGEQGGWRALTWALDLATREGARLYGLHVVAAEADRESEGTRAVQIEFERLCRGADIQGDLAVGVGQVSRLVCERARLMDLVVLGLSHPYAADPIARLGSGLHTILRRSSAPVTAVPPSGAHLGQVLLAYDGSPKASEALFVATYLAGRRDVPLAILTVVEGDRVTSEALAYAHTYAGKHGVQADLVEERGPAAEAIMTVADQNGADLIIMGGYGSSPMVESALGSTVEHVLESSSCAVLVCQ
jgi:nucleotide-binding universal stress UspA family protein